jgi:uncharacterized protein YjiS (DUF1127 family)
MNWREQMAFVSNTGVPSLGLGQRVSDFVQRLRQAAKARAVYTQTYEELSALTDRDLADLGISRLSIGDVAREASRRA